MHLPAMADTLELLDVRAPEVARRQRVLIAELVAAGRYTPSRQRVMADSLRRLASHHRPIAPGPHDGELYRF